MIDLIPLYEMTAVRNNWEYIASGVKDVLEYAHDDTNMTRVLNEVWSGQALIWLAFESNSYIGFIVTKILATPLGEKSLLIYMAYSNRSNDKETYIEAFDQLTRYAKETGCTSFQFYTVRDKAFERVLEPHGWKPKYTVFTKEVV